jgi:sugar/nucleoside kinase (ribokinase family)
MKREFDILVIGELNVDLILNGLPSLPEEGKEIIANQMTLTLGSSSAIFASNASTLGNKVAFLGKTGTDMFGDLVFKSLEEKKVDTRFIIRSSIDKTGATIVLNFDEDRAMVTYPGAMETLKPEDINENWLSKAGHMHLSSVFLQPALKKEIVSIFKMAKNLGLTTSLDVQWDPAEKWDLNMKELLPLVDVFLPNETELRALTGEQDMDKAIESVKPLINTMAIKMGNKGSRGVTKETDITIKPFLNKKVVDAIGAGDSFNAGFITGFLAGKPLPGCLEYGNLTGAVSTTAAGGTGAFDSLEGFRQKAGKVFGFKENFNNLF